MTLRKERKEMDFMINTLAEQAATVKSVYTPMPLGAHFVFCLIATLVYLALYYMRGSLHYLLIMFAIDATIITQYWTSSMAIILLGAAEILLLGAALYFYIRFAKKERAKAKQKEAARKEAEEKAKAAKSAEKEREDHMVDNAFDDNE